VKPRFGNSFNGWMMWEEFLFGFGRSCVGVKRLTMRVLQV